jgi:rhodanese-related sulfurtransferase
MIASQPRGIHMAPDTIQPGSALQTIRPAEVAARRSQSLHTRLIDVRTPVEFAEVHAEGAQLIPLDALDPKAVMSDRNGSDGEPIYVICKSGGRSAKAVEKFRAAGFTDVLSVEGGTTAWEQAGLPVVRGTNKVISLARQVRVGAGSLVLLGVLLGWLIHPAFFALSALAGGGLVFAGITDWCGMAMLLAGMPWNQTGCYGGSCSR